VQYLAESIGAFRRKTEQVSQQNKGNFLRLIEMLAKFNPTKQGHVRPIKGGETHDHYLGHQIQNELIELMAYEVKKIINAKNCKVFINT
jgi:hypothetical protein